MKESIIYEGIQFTAYVTMLYVVIICTYYPKKMNPYLFPIFPISLDSDSRVIVAVSDISDWFDGKPQCSG